MLVRERKDQKQLSSVRPAAVECRADLSVLVREFKYVLGKTGRLNDTPHFDSSFLLDQSPYRIK